MRPGDEHEGWVSVWLGTTPVPAGPPVDTLRDLCGVDHYRLDDQESHGSPSPVPVAALFEDVSFIGSFLPEVLAAAQRMDIVRACWMTVQFDFLYDRSAVHRPVADQPVFLGAFQYIAGDE